MIFDQFNISSGPVLGVHLTQPEFESDRAAVGHLKRTVLANVLFETIEDLALAFRKGIARVNGHRDRMGFTFDHDDV